MYTLSRSFGWKTFYLVRCIWFLIVRLLQSKLFQFWFIPRFGNVFFSFLTALILSIQVSVENSKLVQKFSFLKRFVWSVGRTFDNLNIPKIAKNFGSSRFSILNLSRAIVWFLPSRFQSKAMFLQKKIHFKNFFYRLLFWFLTVWRIFQNALLLLNFLDIPTLFSRYSKAWIVL